MGRGSYKASDWAKLRSSISETKKVEDIFANKITAGSLKNDTLSEMTEGCKKGRESRDSEDSPESTPVIIGFDVTASMGYLAKELALNAMNSVITYLYDEKPISNPQILCAAIGDSLADKYPLQVTQFEADIRIIKQLLNLYLEGGGGGNGGESYNLLWYFAAKHTSIDSYNKRQKKGFLFFIGDEICGASHGEVLAADEIRAVFGDKDARSVSLQEAAEMAMEKYEIFHIVTGIFRVEPSYQTWNKFLPGRVAKLDGKQIEYLSEVITSIMQLAAGTDKNEVISQWPKGVQPIIKEAIADIGEPVEDVPAEKKSFAEKLKALFS